MRNLVHRVWPKTPNLPPAGHGAKFWGSNCHASKNRYLLFATLAPQEIDIGYLWSHHVSYTIWNPNWAQSGTVSALSGHLKPGDARKGYHKLTLSTKHPIQVTRFPEL